MLRVLSAGGLGRLSRHGRVLRQQTHVGNNGLLPVSGQLRRPPPSEFWAVDPGNTPAAECPELLARTIDTLYDLLRAEIRHAQDK